MVTAPNFNEQAVTDCFNAVESLVMRIGRFDMVNQHEPKSAPGNGFTAAVWVDSIKPIKRSGLAATSGALCLRVRAYTPFLQQPYDTIDPKIVAGVSEIIAALSGDFRFSTTEAVNDNIRGIDIFGGEGSGETLSARAGYLEIDRKWFRIMTIQVPIVVNDMWTQS